MQPRLESLACRVQHLFKLIQPKLPYFAHKKLTAINCRRTLDLTSCIFRQPLPTKSDSASETETTASNYCISRVVHASHAASLIASAFESSALATLMSMKISTAADALVLLCTRLPLCSPPPLQPENYLPYVSDFRALESASLSQRPEGVRTFLF